jgi:hypothetical protein
MEEAVLLELLQDAADARAREVQTGLFGDQGRRDRLRRLDIIMNDPLQKVALAFLDDFGL